MISHPLSCGETVRALWDYLDHALPGEMRSAVEEHLSHCTNCAGHVAFARRMLEAIERTPVADADVARLDARVRAALRAEAGAG
jgi:anti-sigma factor RsiW